MADYSDFAGVDSITLTGSEVEYEVPEGVTSIAFYPSENCTLYFESGATVTWPLVASTKEAINDAQNLGNRTIYFGGGAAGSVKIRWITGRG